MWFGSGGRTRTDNPLVTLNLLFLVAWTISSSTTIRFDARRLVSEPFLDSAFASFRTWLLIALFFRYSSLASLVASAFAPFYYVVGGGTLWYVDARIGVSIGIMAALQVWRHKENIGRLIAGKESKIGSKKKS